MFRPPCASAQPLGRRHFGRALLLSRDNPVPVRQDLAVARRRRKGRQRRWQSRFEFRRGEFATMRVSAVLPAEGHYRRALRQQTEIVEVVVGKIDAVATLRREATYRSGSILRSRLTGVRDLISAALTARQTGRLYPRAVSSTLRQL